LKAHDEQLLEHEKTQRDKYYKDLNDTKQKQLDSMKTLIDDGKFGPISLEDDNQKRELHKALFVPTERYVYNDEQGQQVTTRITKYQQRLNEFHASTEQQLVFAKFLIDGFDMHNVEQQAVQKQEASLLDILNAKTTSRAASPATRQVPSQIPESKPVFEMDVGT
jgi:hypothetical protein